MKDILPESPLSESLEGLPAFILGKAAGLKADEPDIDLNQVTRTKIADNTIKNSLLLYIRDHEKLVPEKVAYRKGYFEGIQGFLVQHNVSLRNIGIYNFPEVLSSERGLRGFMKGLRREDPAIERDFSIVADKKSVFDYERPVPEWEQKFKFESGQALNGYEIGFVIGIARDFGVTLQLLEIPQDNRSFEIFMKGLEGQTRPPILKNYSESRYDYVDSKADPYYVFEAMNEQMYHAGLRVWLATQNIAGIDTYQIRHPSALEAFKAGLSGLVLSEYEQPLLVNSAIREKDYFLGEYSKPSPQEIARNEGYEGYQLGKTARTLSTINQVSPKSS